MRFLSREKAAKKCSRWWHKWVPVFIKGKYNNIDVKFIGCYCRRCGKGREEILDANGKLTERHYGTYNEKYFDN